ncbi:hypothetical protein FGB62_113g118 [Gracilaria domingensis]|nr:hypothetical protein FGB62_113g118 [Gracilaria domingensis]
MENSYIVNQILRKNVHPVTKAAKCAAKNVVISTGNEAELLTVGSMRKRLSLSKSKQRKPRSKLQSQTSGKAAVMSEKESMAPAGPGSGQTASKEMNLEELENVPIARWPRRNTTGARRRKAFRAVDSNRHAAEALLGLSSGGRSKENELVGVQN